MTEEEIESELSAVFNSFVRLSNIHDHSREDVSLVVCDVAYGDSGKTRQTVVLLKSADLDFPNFTMRPPGNSPLAGLLGGRSSLAFTDVPAFDAQYEVSGLKTEALQVLFAAQVREQLAGLGGWNVYGTADRLVAFQSGWICDDDERESFIGNALQILQALREGEAELDARPAINRESTGADLLMRAEQMGGIGGSILASQLEKIAISEDEFATFVDSTPPREIPIGMKRQVAGWTASALAVGFISFAAGSVFGAIVLITKQPLPIALIPLPMTLIGVVMFVLTYRFRRRKLRVLQQGTLVEGVVEDVKASNTIVNGQLRHVAHVRYEHAGSTQTTQCNLLGTAADNARRRMNDGKPVSVLIDPTDTRQAVVLDLLTIL